MKKQCPKIIVTAVTVATVALSLPNAIVAQNIGELVSGADAAGQAGDWAKAYPLYKQTTELHSEEDAAELFADKMGYLWYRRAQSAMILGQLAKQHLVEEERAKAAGLIEDAITSFKKAAAIGETSETNTNKNKANYNLGQVYLAAEQYEEALKAWETFDKQYDGRNPTEKFIKVGKGKGKYILEKSISLLSQTEPDIELGEKGLLYIMKPEVKAKYQISESFMISGFRAYCTAIKKQVINAKGDRLATAKIEAQLINFLEKNRATLTLSSHQMYKFTPLFLGLAIEFKDIEIDKDTKISMDKAAFALMSFLPNTKISKESMESTVESMSAFDAVQDNLDIIYKVNVEGTLTQLEKNVDKGEPHEMSQNLIMASYYEQEGNSRAAFAIFDMIELYHSDHPKREEWLYNLVRTSYNIGKVHKTVEFGERYLAAFSTGANKAAVEEFMLTSLFRNGRYDECIAIANKSLLSATEGSKAQDVALYCLGGSYYYKGLPDKAAEPLAKHVELFTKGGKFEESAHIVSTSYWSASNETYLFKWKEAGAKLDNFLTAYPDAAQNSFLALAKLDRARCFTNLEDYKASVKMLNLIIAQHQDSPIIAQAYSLMGNNNQSLSVVDAGVKEYKKALELSRQLKQEGIEAESLNFLITILGDSSQPDKTKEEKEKKAANYNEAVTYYDDFWAKYSKGPYKAYVAIAGLDPLMAAKRGEEGLQNLKTVMISLANEGNTSDIERAVNSYTQTYLSIHNNNAKQLEEHYTNDFNFKTDQYYTRSLVKMSLVSAYEDLGSKAKKNNDKPAEVKWQRAISTQLEELKSFPLVKMNNYTMVRIADNIQQSAKTLSQYKSAEEFYDAVISNDKSGKDSTYKSEAIFGIAKVLTKTGEKVKMKKALTTLNQLKTDKNTDAKTKERAFATTIELYSTLENHEETVTQGKAFVKEYKSSRFRTTVRQAMANSYEQLGDAESAVNSSNSIIASAKGNLSVTGPEVLRFLRLKEDKFAGYVAGYKFVKSRKVSFDQAIEEGKMPNHEKALWEEIQKVMKSMENLPQVVEGLKQLEIKEAARQRSGG